MTKDLPESEDFTEAPKKPIKRQRRRKKKDDFKNNVVNDNSDGEIIVEGQKVKKTKKSNSRTKPIDYADENPINPSIKSRRVNGTIMANAKRSYCMKRGIGSCLKNQGVSIMFEYKRRLRRLLKKLIRRHNWVDAAGVLGVLLKATTRDKSSRHNRFKYWAAMEILKQIKGGNIRSKKIQNVYDLWMKKDASMMTRSSRSVKEKIAIQLEYILFCLTHGDLVAAHQNSLGLMQEHNFESDPTSNLVVGLTFYELWYSDLPEDWQLKTLNYAIGSMESDFHEGRSNSDDYNGVESQEDNISVELKSVTSVANDKENKEIASTQERVPMDVDDNLETQSPQQSVCHNDSYVYSAEGSEDRRSSSPAYDGGLSIFQAPGLPTWLMPLEMPLRNDNLDDVICDHRDFQNDYYTNAVKHLQVALHSTPPMGEALHPLIQLLLIGDRVNEALYEIDNFFDDSATVLKLRLKAGLLEHFDRGNHLQLSSCYEDILEIDPTCSNSLVKLINMHQRGDYGTEKLVKMLALYLDGTYAEFNIWKDLAYCLMKLSQCAGDRISTCSNRNAEKINQSYTGHSNQIPELFTGRESGKTWRFRCRWWLTRHFSSNILASEIAAGEFSLLTYKAAVAAFLYGPEFKYVTKAIEVLENESTNQDMYSILRIHVKNSVGIYKF
ncbi:hypothetical protein LIER_25852 [Lithospermum erythrorhizon]|uniref:Uncharacterized protein n=1 Tax=Lithospermum erythrorhizon TaxID=34254 RepID=A0AAV3R8E9_LITER